MTKYWKNAKGFSMMLLDVPQHKAHLTVFDATKYPMVSKVYEWWNTERSARDAECLASMGSMDEVDATTFYATSAESQPQPQPQPQPQLLEAEKDAA